MRPRNFKTNVLRGDLEVGTADGSGAADFADFMLALRQFLGGTLGGIGVTILVTNTLVCIVLLLLGPNFFVGLLPA
jgi:hypothetical protein